MKVKVAKTKVERRNKRNNQPKALDAKSRGSASGEQISVCNYVIIHVIIVFL